MSSLPSVEKTSIAAVHPDIIQSHILNRLDGATLASAACASAQFLSLCSDDSLWQHICNSAWPSTADPRVRRAIAALPYAHRSFFSDAFPARRHPRFESMLPRVPELISAVDIRFDGRIIFSKVLVTETLSNWFLCTPFRLDLLDPKETVAMTLDLSSGDDNDDNTSASAERAAGRFSLSWILIDPAGKRSINVASVSPVEVRRHWLMDDVQLRFATVMAAANGELLQCAVVLTLGGKPRTAASVKEVTLQVEEMEGKIVTGAEGLKILRAAMEGEKWKRDGGIEKDVYERFTKMKARFRERKQKREKGLDMACIATGISIFAALLFWIICLWR